MLLLLHGASSGGGGGPATVDSDGDPNEYSRQQASDITYMRQQETSTVISRVQSTEVTYKRQ